MAKVKANFPPDDWQTIRRGIKFSVGLWQRARKAKEVTDTAGNFSFGPSLREQLLPLSEQAVAEEKEVVPKCASEAACRQDISLAEYRIVDDQVEAIFNGLVVSSQFFSLSTRRPLLVLKGPLRRYLEKRTRSWPEWRAFLDKVAFRNNKEDLPWQSSQLLPLFPGPTTVASRFHKVAINNGLVLYGPRARRGLMLRERPVHKGGLLYYQDEAGEIRFKIVPPGEIEMERPALLVGYSLMLRLHPPDLRNLPFAKLVDLAREINKAQAYETTYNSSSGWLGLGKDTLYHFYTWFDSNYGLFHYKQEGADLRLPMTIATALLLSRLAQLGEETIDILKTDENRRGSSWRYLRRQDFYSYLSGVPLSSHSGAFVLIPRRQK